jgi:hypothetical protein
LPDITPRFHTFAILNLIVVSQQFQLVAGHEQGSRGIPAVRSRYQERPMKTEQTEKM